MVERSVRHALDAVGIGWNNPGSAWDAAVCSSPYGLPSRPAAALVVMIGAVREQVGGEQRRVLDDIRESCGQPMPHPLFKKLDAFATDRRRAEALYESCVALGTESARHLAGVIAITRARRGTTFWAASQSGESPVRAIPYFYDLLFRLRRDDPALSASTQLEVGRAICDHATDGARSAARVDAIERVNRAETQVREVVDYDRALRLRYHLSLARVALQAEGRDAIIRADLSDLCTRASFLEDAAIAYTARMLAATVANRSEDRNGAAQFFNMATQVRTVPDLSPVTRVADHGAVLRYRHDVATEVELGLAFNRHDVAVGSLLALLDTVTDASEMRDHELARRVDDPRVWFRIDQRIIEQLERSEGRAARDGAADAMTEWRGDLIHALDHGIASAKAVGEEAAATLWSARRHQLLKDLTLDHRFGIG